MSKIITVEWDELSRLYDAIVGQVPVAVSVSHEIWELEKRVRELIIDGNKETRRRIAGAVAWALLLRVKDQQEREKLEAELEARIASLENELNDAQQELVDLDDGADYREPTDDPQNHPDPIGFTRRDLLDAYDCCPKTK